MNKAFELILERLEDLRDGLLTTNTEYNSHLIDAMMRVGQIVQEVAEEYNGGWIPCSERMPDVDADVLLTLRSLDIYTGFRANTDGYFYVEGTDDGYIPYENVIAWQPLPEPYKERD